MFKIGGVFKNPPLTLRWVLLEYNSFDQFPNKPRNQIFCPLNSSAWYDETFFCLPKSLEEFHKSCLATRKVLYCYEFSVRHIFVLNRWIVSLWT